MLPIDPPLTKAKLIDTAFGPFVSNDQQEHIATLIDRMQRAEGPQQAQLARFVLAYDRENIDALVTASKYAGSMSESLAILREALRIGVRLWGGPKSRKSSWWWDPGTRPFMAAILAYGEALAAADQVEDAARCFEHLLKMQPEDGIGARSALDALKTAYPTRVGAPDAGAPTARSP